MKEQKLVMVGASAGGITAVQRLLELLSPDFTLPLAIVQHLPAGASVDPVLVYGRVSKRAMCEISDKMTIQPSSVYFAPASYHLLLEKDFSFSLTQDEPVHYARPSIDVAFQSAALSFGGEVSGVLLTGANTDGAMGLRDLASTGSITLVQDPKEAESPYMPAAAIELFRPSFVGSLEEIAKKLSLLEKGEWR